MEPRKRKETYRMPNGDITTSYRKFRTAWMKGMPIMKKVYGLQISAFDPGYSFNTVHNGKIVGCGIQLPYDLVQKMIATAQFQLSMSKVSSMC